MARTGCRRVLMTADAVGGVWTYALELARALAPHGVEVALATMGPVPTEAQRREARELPNLELHESAYRLEWMEEPWDDVAAAGEWLLELERSLRPDVVHVNGYAHGALPWSAPVVLAGHSCVLSWWRAVRGEEAGGEWSRYRFAVTRGLRAADLVVAPSTAMLLSLQRDYGPLRNRRVIYNGRDPRRFAPSGKGKEEIVLTAGRLWDEAKNIALLDLVAADLPWPIYMAGEATGPEGGPVSLENVRALGRLAPDRLAAWLGHAAIYALPARYEPFGLSILEAGLAGCALVVGDVASLREIWGDTALFVPPDSPERLLDVLQRLVGDAEMCRQYGARARRRALQLTPARMAGAYVEAYDELLETRAAHDLESDGRQAA